MRVTLVTRMGPSYLCPGFMWWAEVAGIAETAKLAVICSCQNSHKNEWELQNIMSCRPLISIGITETVFNSPAQLFT